MGALRYRTLHQVWCSRGQAAGKVLVPWQENWTGAQLTLTDAHDPELESLQTLDYSNIKLSSKDMYQYICAEQEDRSEDP